MADAPLSGQLRETRGPFFMLCGDGSYGPDQRGRQEPDGRVQRRERPRQTTKNDRLSHRGLVTH